MEKVRSGTVIGHYQLTDLLGSGGFATVYKAQCIGSTIPYAPVIAIKALHPRRMEKTPIRKFREEAQILLALRHENIIHVFDFVEWEGNFLIIMEFVDTDLNHLPKKKPLTEKQILTVMRKAVRGLQHAHGKGIVHKDFTPSNILVSLDLERVKITDFGIAGKANVLLKELFPGMSDPRSGTSGYFAPEQYEGKYDKRSDIYAFGRTLHKLFRDCSLPVPPRIEQIIQTAIKHNPAERFQDLQDVLYFLDRAEEEGGLPDPQVSALRYQMSTAPAAARRADAPSPPSAGPEKQGPDIEGVKDFLVRVDNREYSCVLQGVGRNGELMFSVTGNHRPEGQIIRKPGEVLYEKGQRYTFSCIVHSPDTRRIVVTDCSRPLRDRREEMRVKTPSLSADIQAQGTLGARPVKGFILNLSLKGAFFRTDAALNPNVTHSLSTSLGTKEFSANFLIRDVQQKKEGYLYSVQFQPLLPKDESRLKAYLAGITRRGGDRGSLEDLDLGGLWKKQ